jgi:7-carboxy-7-deazaguanine synthase
MTTDAKVSYEYIAEDKRLPVIEIFGPVIQGEGAMIGRVTHFLRLGGCGYRCDWCDSLHAVLPEEVKKNAKRLAVTQITDALLQLGSPHTGAKWVTISGGDPVMYELSPLIDRLHYEGFRVAIETQGQFFKQWLINCDSVTVSPKPPSSGMAEKLDRDMLSAYSSLIAPPRISLKVVIMDLEDLEWATQLHADYPRVNFFLSVGTQNNGETDSDVLASKILTRYRWLIEEAQKYGLANVSILPQMHAMLYGHKLGV